MVGLREGWNLTDSPYILYNNSEIKFLQNWLKDKNRMMLAVIVAECEPKQPDVSSLPLPANLSYSSPLNSAMNPIKILITPIQMTPIDPADKDEKIPIDLLNKDEEYPIDIVKLARYKLGYAQFFVLPFTQLENFRKITCQTISAGDIYIFEPSYFGGEVIKHNYNRIKVNPEIIYKNLEEYIQNYTKGKPMTYGKVLFLTEAKENESKKAINLKHTKTELVQAFNERMQAKDEHHKDELRFAEERSVLKDEKIKRLTDQISNFHEKSLTHRAEMDSLEAKYFKQILEKDAEIQRLHALLDRPNRPNEVANWVENYLHDKLIFHQRARTLMDNLPPNTKDVNVICDALEFLATDYRDELTGLIDEDEMRCRCKQKYDRPFNVVPNKSISVEMHPGEYKIKYYQGIGGKPIDSPLDLHLRIGNDGSSALRIYFLYDKQKKLIVVGSLPHHLRTLSDK